MSEKQLERKNNILSICEKLKELNLITVIYKHKYSIQILINCDEDFKKESIKVRDRIKDNF
jgi:hypothetical protein